MKTKKAQNWKIIIPAIFLAVVMAVAFAATSVTASDTDYTDEANALYYLGLFKGTEKGYRLEKTLNRAEAVTLIIRLSGQETEALESKATHPFKDVPSWADRYIAFAYSEGITNGKSATRFDSLGAVRDCEFLTLILRLLGYKDGGNNPDFKWDAPYTLSRTLCLTSSTSEDKGFVRGDAVAICFSTLSCRYESTGKTVAATLISKGIISQDDYNTAVQIVASGQSSEATSSTAPDTSTAAPDTSTVAPDTSTAAPDTSTAAPDTSTAAPDTSTAAPDTSTAAPDTSTAAPDTSTAAPDVDSDPGWSGIFKP